MQALTLKTDARHVAKTILDEPLLLLDPLQP